MKNFVITIGRQYGSGGREVGRQVAEKLGVPFYDKEIITASVKETGLDAKIFEEMEERVTPSFLYSLAVGTFTPSALADTNYFSLNDRVNAIQADTIKRLADESSCVIVGRAADDILANQADCFNVFVHADLEERIRRASEEYGIKGDPRRGGGGHPQDRQAPLQLLQLCLGQKVERRFELSSGA